MLDADTGGWLVANRTSDNEAVLRLQSKHRARLAEIRAFNKPPPSKQLAHRWSESPYGSKPHYSHVSRNAKRAQVEGERHQAIERDNLLLLQKMTTLLSSGASSRAGSAASSRRDPTVGTWEFAPGVRLNRNQVPVIDHCVSPDPAMPQRGAARLAESLNGGARRRELERITRENLAIVQRIQGRGAHYPRAAMHAHAAAHSRYLQQLRKETARPGFDDRPPSRPGSVPARRPPAARPATAEARGRIPPDALQRFVRRGSPPPPGALLRAAPEGATELWLGIASGFAPGEPAVLEPGGSREETVVVADVALGRGGLALRLAAPCRRDHAAGAVVLQAPAPPMTPRRRPLSAR